MFSRSQWLALSLLFAGLSGNLLAVDGVILIDQNRALAGGVTPGDAPGFPITISVPGAYRLSGNLSVPPSTNGIEITVSNVTIDLNGFGMSTPTNQNTGPRFGIHYIGAANPSGFVIRNGLIEGFSIAVLLNNPTTDPQNSVLDSLILHWGLANYTGTFNMGPFSVVRNVSAPDQDLNITCPSVVTASAFDRITATAAPPATCSLTGNATSF